MIQPRTQSIILHLDNLEALKCLSATSMGNLMFALMNYAACGEMPQDVLFLSCHQWIKACCF